MRKYKKYLNPIVDNLEKIRDFSGIKPKDQLEEEEYPNLIATVDKVANAVDRYNERLETLYQEIEYYIKLIDSETGDDKTDAIKDYNRLMGSMEKLVFESNRQLDTLDVPYFGKIRLDRKGTSEIKAKTLDVYIGKLAFFDKDSNQALISDWRAPIANLYYQNSGPKDDVSFNSPLGEIKGDLRQKRQFEISGGRIHAIYDAKSGNVAADQFLLSQLNKRIGKKLAEIVSTIQSQQNEIIREKANTPLLIQGVAGSGKTTIILHRLAYLFYTYSSTIRPEKSLIIAPNMMFLDYISDVLPSLGVRGLEQNTYLFWARNLLGFSETFALSTIPDDMSLAKFKGSAQFKDLIGKYFIKLEKEIFEGIKGGLGYDVEDRYFELKEKHPNMSMIERLDLSVEYAFAQQQFKGKRTGLLSWNLELVKERRKQIKDHIKDKTNVYKIYKELFKRDDPSGWCEFGSLSWEEVSKKSLKQLQGATAKTKGYKVEDLAPMVWLHLKINGLEEFQKEHVVVDEAQDLSTFQLITLFAIAKEGNITIAGDLAQSIIPPFYINSWEDLIVTLKESFDIKNGIAYHQLFRSYRTTIEIIKYANKIFRRFFPKSYRLPEAVLRHGNEVELIETNSLLSEGGETDYDNLVRLLNLESDKGAISTALICKNEEHANNIIAHLRSRESDLESTLVSFNDDNYHSGILVLPVSRAKGLEFDSVIILDANKEIYPGDELDVRLFYVAVTRALHRLYITYSKSGERSPLI